MKALNGFLVTQRQISLHVYNVRAYTSSVTHVGRLIALRLQLVYSSVKCTIS